MQYALKVLRQNQYEIDEAKEDEVIMKMKPSMKIVSPQILEESDTESAFS